MKNTNEIENKKMSKPTETGNQLVPTRSKIATITNKKPADMVKSSTDLANVLSDVINKTKAFAMISGKKHVNVEGWTTMGAMLGVFPYVEYSRKLDREDEMSYESRVILKTMAGQVIGAGEALASNKEGKTWGQNEYSVKSMAETRATGKAFRLSFSWVMSLAGFEPTPVEEMPQSPAKAPVERQNNDTRPTGYDMGGSAPKATQGQIKLISQMVTKHREDGQQYNDLAEFEEASGFKVADLSLDQAEKLIVKLMHRAKEIDAERNHITEDQSEVSEPDEPESIPGPF